MPRNYTGTTFTDNLDEGLVFDAFPDFSGGQVSAPRANLLLPTQAVSMQNMQLDTLGYASTRRGWGPFSPDAPFIIPTIANSLQGPAWPLSCVADNASMVGAIVMGDLYPIAPYFPGVANPIGNSTGGYLVDGRSVRPGIAQGLGGVYFTQGGIPLLFYNGCDIGTGYPNNKFKEYTLSPVWQTTYDAAIAAGKSVADATVAANAAAALVPAAPKATICCWHKGRLFLAGVPGQPDTLFPSQLLDPSYYNQAVDAFRVGDGDGDEIVALLSWIETGLIVFKRKSIWVVDADPLVAPANWGTRAITRKIGCLSGNAIANVGGDAFFLSTDGLRSVGRLANTDQAVDVSESLSQSIRDVMDRITPGFEARAAAAYYNGRFYFSVALDGAMTNNTLLVWRDNLDVWEGQWTGPSIAGFCIDPNARPFGLICGTEDGQLYRLQDYTPLRSATSDTYSDNLVNAGQSAYVKTGVVAKLRTRAAMFAEAINLKTGFLLDIEFFNSRSQAVAVRVITDGSAPQLVATVDSRRTGFTQLTLPSTLPCTLGINGICRRTVNIKPYGQWREIQIELEATDGKFMCVRSMIAAAFVDSIKFEQ